MVSVAAGAFVVVFNSMLSVAAGVFVRPFFSKGSVSPISVKNYPRNLFLVQTKDSSMFRPRVQQWGIFGGQKWGGSGIIVQKWGGANKKTKIRKIKTFKVV